MGVIRFDVPFGHPDFGKAQPCPNPMHWPERLAKLNTLSGLSSEDLKRRLSDIRPMRSPEGNNLEILKAAGEMVKNPYGWLYIWGGPGNAKSEILKAIVNELNQAGKGPAMYTTFSRLINWIRDAFKEDADESYIRKFDRVARVKVLAIDEMDKARDTQLSIEFRFNFLDERYQQAVQGQTVTIFAGNTDPEELPEPLWDRVRDGRFKVIHNTAPSARPNMQRAR